jgi:hypothetical protein
MKIVNNETEYVLIKAENAALIKENKNLSKKLENSKCKNKQLQKELKKNDAPKIILTKEQERLLSNLSNDINILNL